MEKLIEQLNQLGYLVNVDFCPDKSCCASILKLTGRDRWTSIGIGSGPTLVDAVEEARIRANINE